MTPADLLDLGLKLFPVTANKKPAYKGWQKYAETATVAHIREEWRKGFRAFGIYLAPSRLVVFDADNQVAMSWADDHLPESPMMTMTRRGNHRFYRLPEGLPPPRDNRPIAGVALDRKAKGYVIAPGSLLGGFVYNAVTFWDTPLDELPLYPVDKLPVEREPVTCCVTVPDLEPTLLGTEIGEWFIANSEDSIAGDNGSRALKKAASFFINGLALSLPHAMAWLSEWNHHRATPPWSDQELQHALDTSAREGAITGRPRGWAYADWTKR